MSTCSTHALDAALGVPAAGLPVTLRDSAEVTLAEAVTDADGRVRFPADLGSGPHSLTFATGPWFAAAGRDTFFPEVRLTFTVPADQQHHHVALLLSPFAYTTYKGS
ncbi:hydroxyisourate hydrolase [Rhodococcus sp. X156]|uniref:hydroxyisourate hydrolase n=1 Tax=Rhodococcus sp. X156 TaxID=2499145 RepID=UPI000FD88187|nr:hydroxyisourate hydrolase [Rhodococcus sp. X156]